MPFRIVQSKQNARLKQLRRALAHPGSDGSRLAGIEGPNLLEEALRAGLHIDCIFVAQGSEHLQDVLRLPPETEILLMPRELLDSALATETPQPIAALVEPPDWTWAHLLGGQKNSAPLVLVLAGLQDLAELRQVQVEDIIFCFRIAVQNGNFHYMFGYWNGLKARTART